MARTVEGIIRNQAETKKITLQTTFPWGEQPLYLLADVRRTEQIIINLLNNAVKYTQPGGKVTWSVTVQEQEERLVLVHTITDNGPGIPPEFQKIMFEPFTPGGERVRY
jgi:signal transduction histidine kinase